MVVYQMSTPTMDSVTEEVSVPSAAARAAEDEKTKKVASLRQNLKERRSTFTPSEFSYIQSLVDNNEHELNDEKISILEENLANTKVFFNPDEVRGVTEVKEGNDGIRTAAVASTGANNTTIIGSERRNLKLEQRRSKSKALWKQATMNIMACNRLMKLGSAKAGGAGGLSNLIRAIKEGDALSESDSDDDEEKKKSENEIDMEANRRNLMTRQASVNMYGGEGFEIGEEALFQLHTKHFDPWDVTSDPEGNPYEFHIIGTSADDVDSHPHVLSPPQMHSLQQYLPYSKKGESFWLKYSLVRDGACKASFLQQLRSEDNTIMAMETLDGEIFGAFASSPWNIQHSYFGTSEAFVWRLKHPREDDDHEDILFDERVRREREIEVFKFSFENKSAQICTHDRIAVGGGTTASPRAVADGTIVQPNQFGFAICFDENSLLEAGSSPSVTFNSPGLAKNHQDGSKFELLNLEVWSLTPCITEQEANRMACQKLFLKRNSISTV